MESLRTLPKAVLHDHLDGGLRPETIVELADEYGYQGLPTHDADELRRWFLQGDSGSLEAYLQAFDHTVSVMQTREALERVAYEAILDHAADGVVYAELRFGPSLHTRRGLSRHEAIEAVLAGVSRGMAQTDVAAGVIVSALRQEEDSLAVAEAAADFVGAGLIGFDLAGPERGFPPDAHLAACTVARRAGLGLTIHAGEGDGPHSIWRALSLCAAQRIGHGVRIVEECIVDSQGSITKLAPLAARVRDHRVPLEVSMTSNLHTGLWPDAEHHPIGALYRAGFAVTINTDNRLMSGITMTDEFSSLVDSQGFTTTDLLACTMVALDSGFGDYDQRRRIRDEVVRPAYADAI
ncbi:MAG: adenosine deaminase [Acidimicrobiia bacterium]|nr:adenosine deaminase [Acidimicrobiia bacterium]